MPAALERKLKKEAKKKGIKDKDAYVYGTLRKTGWKPSREKKMDNQSKLVRLERIDKNLDSIIQFQYDQNQHPLLKTGTTAAVGAGGLALHQAVKRTGGYGANIAAMKTGQDLLGQATGNVAAGTGAVGAALKPAASAAASAGKSVGSVAGKVWSGLKKAFVPAAETLVSDPSKAIEFDATILGPWQGHSGHETKIDQYEFPAGLSPAAVLKFPFPKLMAYLNRRNILQQQFSWKQGRLIQLSAKLDEINA